MNYSFSLLFASVFFSVCSMSAQKIDAVSSSEISIIEAAPTGNLWIGLKAGGCVKYDPTNGSVSKFDKSNTLMRTDSVSAVDMVTINNKLNVLMATEDGVYINKQGVWDSVSNLPDADVNDIALAQNGNLVFATDDSGIIVYDTNYNWIKSLNKKTIPSMPTNSIYELARRNINCNKIYAATDNGIVSVDVSTNALTVYDKVTTNMPSDDVHCILANKTCNNEYVVGTDKGISVCAGTTCTNYSNTNGLSSNNISTLERDSLGRLWIGTEDSGLIVYDNVNFTKITKADGLPSNIITDITCISNSCTCYVGTEDAGVVQIGCDKKVVKKLNISSVIDVQNQKVLVLYPQPASDRLHFDLTEQVSNIQFTMIDFSGKIVKSQYFEDITQFDVPVLDIPNGIYSYIIRNNKGLSISGKTMIAK